MKGEKGSKCQGLFSSILFLLLLGLIFGCATEGGGSGGNTNEHKHRLMPVAIPGLNPASVAPGEYVFDSSNAWSDFWSKYFQTEPPELDLKDYTLIAVFLGRKPNTGYSVRIAAATEYETEVVVDVVEYSPSPGMMYAQVIVYPYDAVLIPKTDKRVQFNVTKKVGMP